VSGDRSGGPHSGAGGARRLNRLLALAGLGSRRAVEDLILAGRVAVDGEVVTDLGRRVDPAHQKIAVDGLPLEIPADRRVYAFHKPRGVVSTLRPQGGQRGLAEFRDAAGLLPRMMPVGRLDADTAGLLLWTDDGALSQALMRPASGVAKRYRVVCRHPLPPSAVARFARGGLAMDGRALLPCGIEPGRPPDGRHWWLTLHEGRNRQIRRMFAAVQNRVVELTRTAVGPVELGRLREGGFRRLRPQEERALRAAAAGGCDGAQGGVRGEARRRRAGR
jgi:23S rRNA pseudouridine2605 synthase/16S rRNA pseudouridine516 synthase